jgi:hypothetical protein
MVCRRDFMFLQKIDDKVKIPVRGFEVRKKFVMQKQILTFAEN